MSFQAMAWAVDQPVKGLGKLVLLLLANYTGKDGICFPSQKELAHQCGITDRAVRTWLDRLEQDGYISRKERRRIDGTRTTDNIILAMPKQPEPRSARPLIKRNETTGQPEPRSAIYKDEPITEPITKRKNLGNGFKALSETLATVIETSKTKRRSPSSAAA